MMRYGPRWAGPLRTAVVVSALALAALAALFLTGLLLPRDAESAGGFSVNGLVTKTRVDYTEPCDPGNFVSAAGIGTTISTSQGASLGNPIVIDVDGDIKGCLATDGLPTGSSAGRLLIEDATDGDANPEGKELFFYSVIAARTVDAITSTTYTGAVALEDLPDQHANDWPDEFPASGQAFIGLELVNYTRSSSTFTITSRNKNALSPTYLTHPARSLVRVQGKLKLVARNQRIYVGYRNLGEPTSGIYEHSSSDGSPADVRSPKIQLTCRGRLQQTSMFGLDPVVSRTRCYAVLEPGSPWLSGPVPNAALLVFFHGLSTGTIDDKDTDGQTLTLITDVSGFQCSPHIVRWLWTKTTTTITLDTNFTAKDDDVGEFRITLYPDLCSTPVSSIDPLGQQDNLPAEGGLGATLIGTNFRSLQAHVGHDTDGDGCSDYNELGTNLITGGLRDPFNRWDYFNPSNNATNRGKDISAVVAKFGHDQGVATDYDTKYDRNGPIPGSNGWNLQPPNGTIRGQDITAAVQSFGHDCPAPPAGTPTPKPP